MTLVTNKKVFFDYEILERFEAGIALFGYEVKAIRKGKASLVGSRVIVRGSEAFLVGASVSPYQEANTPKGYDSTRPRKLLLHEKEIARLGSAEGKKGLTIVPISMYNKRRNIKLEIAIARGKKKTDKRQSIKARDTKRDLARELKRNI